MGLQPLGNRIIIKPDEAKQISKGGIHIPEIAKEKPLTGTVIAVGPGKNIDGKLIEMTVKVSDKVMFGSFSGHTISHDNERYLIMSESDIYAVIE